MQTFKHNIEINGVFLAFLDGQKCAVIAHFYEEIAKALNFPDYFSPNLDSFDECLNDLSWIPQKEIQLLIFNYEDLLYEEQYHLEVINNIFANAIGELEDKGIFLTVSTQTL